MAKKEIILGFLLTGAGLGLMLWQSQQQVAERIQQESAIVAPIEEGNIEEAQQIIPKRKIEKTELSLFKKKVLAPVVKEKESVAFVPQVSQTVILENEELKVVFTAQGAAIQRISLKNHKKSYDSDKPFSFSQVGKMPALGLALLNEQGEIQAWKRTYQVIAQEASKVIFQCQMPEGILIEREYRLSTPSDKKDPYVIQHTIHFKNGGTDSFDVAKIYLDLGTILQEKSGQKIGEFVSVAAFNGKDTEFVSLNQLKANKGFFGFGARDEQAFIEKSSSALHWGAIKSQFFAAVFTPKIPAKAFRVEPLSVNTSNGIVDGLTGYLQFELPTLAPGKTFSLEADYYVGPKEYVRLESLGHQQESLMQFGFFSFFSKLLLMTLVGIHSLVPNWGLAIILITFLIKLILWPLTAAQVRSTQRMALIQKPLQLIKEKYKSQPQKIQTETLKLFREHKINPALGCLPVVFQIPIFLGLYYMLRTSSELRFASFLWIKDLSMADTVCFIKGFPLNPLPLLMGLTMFLQMKMTPTPTTDVLQKKMLQAMPLIFLIFCYQFPAGLVLYWTVQNCLTILQQRWMSRLKPSTSTTIVINPQKN